MRFRNARVILTIPVLLCAGLAVSPMAAHAAPGKPGPGTPAAGSPAFFVNQGRIMRFNTWIREDNPGIDASGYLASVDDAPHLTVTLLWHGPATPLLRAIMADGQSLGLTVKVEYRKYGASDLDAATAAAYREAAKIPGYRIAAVDALAADYDGIQIEGYYLSRSATAEAEVSVLPARVAADTGVTAEVKPGRPAAGFAARAQAGRPSLSIPAAGPSGTRDQDYSPYSASGFMHSPTLNAECSTGFGISVNGVAHILTARHCVKNPNNGANVNDYEAMDYHADKYGSVAGFAGNSGMAAYLSAAGYGSMFDGPYNTGTVRNIAGFADVGLNDYVCVSGGNSGTHCNIQITNMFHSYTDGWGPYVNTIYALQLNNTIALMPGDSGSGVYQFDGVRWWAVGMAQDGTVYTSPCGTARVPYPCTLDVIFTSVHTILKEIPGSAILTH